MSTRSGEDTRGRAAPLYWLFKPVAFFPARRFKQETTWRPTHKLSVIPSKQSTKFTSENILSEK